MLDDNAPLTFKAIKMLLASMQKVILDSVDKKISDHLPTKASSSTAESF